jgi:hypothetical protein
MVHPTPRRHQIALLRPRLPRPSLTNPHLHSQTPEKCSLLLMYSMTMSNTLSMHQS